MQDQPTPKSVRTLIAPDKFKGSLTAAEVADALAAGLRSAAGSTGNAGRVHCELLPLADGGDGSVDAAVASGFSRRSYTVAGPTGQHVPASIAFDGVTAVVEVANSCGLGLLPDGTLEPLNSSSRGFGEAVLFALSLNPGRIVLALGGSASTDGGMGMLTALGYTFRDAGGRQLYGSGRDLARIRTPRTIPCSRPGCSARSGGTLVPVCCKPVPCSLCVAVPETETPKAPEPGDAWGPGLFGVR